MVSTPDFLLTFFTDVVCAVIDYPQLAEAAKELGVDIRIAYGEALAEKEDEERESDRYCKLFDFLSHQKEEAELSTLVLDRAKDYVELNEQVEVGSII